MRYSVEGVRSMTTTGVQPASAHRRLLSSMAIVALGVSVGKLATVGKDILVSRAFGLDRSVDLFFIAALVPLTAVNAIAGATGSAFTPAFVEAQQHGHDEATGTLRRATWWTLLALLGQALGMAVLATPILELVGGKLAMAEAATARWVLLVVLAAFVSQGLVALWSSALNVLDAFATTSLAPTITSVTTALAVVVGTRSGAWALAIGLAVGGILEAVLLFVALSRRGYPPWPMVTELQPREHKRARGMLPLIVGNTLMGLTPLVDQSMASRLGAGSVAALNYGAKVPALATGVLVTILSRTLLPAMSRYVQHGQYNELRTLVRTYVCGVFGLGIAAVIVGIAASEEVVRLLFQRGAFSPSDTVLVARIQSAYILQVPWYAAGMVLVQLLLALGHNRRLLMISAVNVVANIGFNILFSRSFGVPGIALSTSVVYAISFCALVLVSTRHLGRSAAS